MRLNCLTVLALLASLLIGSCRRSPSVPAAESKEYRELCSAFYLGLAALQSGEDVNARKGLTRSTEIAPNEPAGWVNLGLLEARQQEYEAAYQRLEKARSLAPDNSQIESLLGAVENGRGNLAAALAHYRRAVDLDNGNLRALYKLATETEREQTDKSTQEALALLERILKLRPQNQPVQLDVVRLAAKQNDAARVQKAVNALADGSRAWPEGATAPMTELRNAAAKGDFRQAAIQTQFLRNTLLRELSFRRSLEEIRAPGTSVGEPFTAFLRLPSPRSEPSAADQGLRFESQPLPGVSAAGTDWAAGLALDEDGAVAVLWTDGTSVRIQNGSTLPIPRLPNGGTGKVVSIHNIASADLNYDFKPDLVLATHAGLRIYQQAGLRKFVDVTAKTGLPVKITQGAYTGAWPTDFDLDGDLDVLLGSSQGDPIVIRNNGDGTFTAAAPFQGVNGVLSFSNADVDADGVPDVAIVDSTGALTVFRNERLGVYKRRPVPPQVAGQNRAVVATDANGDGFVDFLVLRADGRVARLSDRDYGKTWDVAELAQIASAQEGVELLAADLDNNGAIDLIAGGEVLLGDGKGFARLTKLPGLCCSVAYTNHDGRLDLIGLSADGKPMHLVNRGTKKYRWQVIRTKAATVMGDQRMNSFGIGGEMEIRSGLLTQKQMILAPALHFGLGDHKAVEFARIVWPNGIIQTEFNLQPEQAVLAQQRLKGSCPFLFSWDGRQMRFLKDVAPMSAPIGAHHDATTLEDVEQTEQWFRIAGDQLTPRDGYYDLRLTNEYWETHYIDFYSLIVVDHPSNSHVFVDERVAWPPAERKIYVTGKPRPFARAADDRGRDVGAEVSALDASYLAGFGVGQYQGITRDHWVELEVPADAPAGGALYLLGDGFINPWDDTITMARSQRGNLKPEDLRIEVPNARGEWQIAQQGLGMPAGRLKTVVVEISRIFVPGAPRKLRLRTNMEVYWDRLAWAAGLEGQSVRTQSARLSAAELRHRGFSLITKAGPSAPELAHYDQVVRTGEQWRSLEGYYTRYGDVRPLLDKVDDRIVIANSGDELRLRFEAIPSPAEGWVRDFVFVGDGWIKEGDYNFRLSKTVLPLPYHGLKNYSIPLRLLEEDQAYRRNTADWRDFHTRYVTAEQFVRALWKR